MNFNMENQNYDVAYIATSPDANSIVKSIETRKSAKAFAKQVIDAVIEGNEYPLTIWKRIIMFETALKAIKDGIKDYAINQAYKNEPKLLSERKTFDFSVCNDSQYNELSLQFEQIKNALKERELFLKTIKEPITIVDEATGEVTKLMPPTWTANTILIIK